MTKPTSWASFVAPRALLSLALGMWLATVLIAAAIFSSNLSYRPDFAYTSVTHFNPNLPLWVRHWVAPWANFDGVHYLAIAGDGYIDQGRFFPVYPAAIATFSWLLGGADTFSTKQLLLANILSVSLFVAMIVVWYKLLQNFYSQQEVLWSLALYIAFPSSFFLISVYTESLFLLLAGLSFLLAYQRRWWLAVAAASVLVLTRLTGFMIVPALMLLYWQQQNLTLAIPVIKKHWWHLARLTLPLLSLVAYAYFNFTKWGDWLYFLHAHSQLGNSRTTTTLVFPLVTAYRYVQIITSISPKLHEFSVAILEMSTSIFMAIIFCLSWFTKIPRWLLLFAGLALLIPILSGTLSGFPRYALVALPLFLPLGSLSTTWKWCLLSTFFVLQLVLLSWFSTGYFVG